MKATRPMMDMSHTEVAVVVVRVDSAYCCTAAV